VNRRYFSATRVVARVRKNLSLGLSQSVVYAAPGRDFELHYVIPSFLYYFGQFGFSDYNATDNVFLSADVDWRFLRQYRLYGEILADDFQVDRDETSRGVQNAIAVLLGLESGGIFCDRLSGGVEFAHVNSYVYKHIGQRPTSYAANTHGGTLGHRIGPDSEELDAWLSLRISRLWQAGLRYTLTRHGDLSDPLGEWGAYDKAKEAVPHGRVEDTHLVLLTGGLAFWHGLSVNGEAGYSVVRNKNNLPGNEADVRIGARLLYHFDRLIQWQDRPTLLPLSERPQP
jgi:hypothetical protein